MCIFLFIFAFLKFSRKATKLHEKGHFTRVFEKWGACAPCAPGSYAHALCINVMFVAESLPEIAYLNQEHFAFGLFLALQPPRQLMELC